MADCSNCQMYDRFIWIVRCEKPVLMRPHPWDVFHVSTELHIDELLALKALLQENGYQLPDTVVELPTRLIVV